VDSLGKKIVRVEGKEIGQARGWIGDGKATDPVSIVTQLTVPKAAGRVTKKKKKKKKKKKRSTSKRLKNGCFRDCAEPKNINPPKNLGKRGNGGPLLITTTAIQVGEKRRSPKKRRTLE